MHQGRGGVVALVLGLAVAVGATSCATRPRTDRLASPLSGAVGTPPDAATTTTTPVPARAAAAAPALHAAGPAPTAPPAPVDPLTAALQGINGCLIVVKDGVPVAAVNPDLPLAPASTLKLLTAAAALTRLGPDFRFVTRVMAPARPRSDGSVDFLWLVGGGDPVLSTPDFAGWTSKKAGLAGSALTPLADLAASVINAGVRSVVGGVHGDDTRYERVRYLSSWPPSAKGDGDIGPLGALSANHGYKAWDPRAIGADDPAAYATAALAGLLNARGVPAGAGDDQTAPPQGVVLAEIPSPPLSLLVADMLRTSDNYMAELLTRELDRFAGGAGTSAGGTRVTAATMASLGLPTTGLAILDGSGLSPGNRSTCRLELSVLQLAARPGLAALHDGLAVAGVSGTLVKRYVGTPAQGKLAAKTGWINGAAALVGNLHTGAPLQFAFIANGPFGWPAAKAREDQLVTGLLQLS
jgi:D-alanyl-D-alanine carboxypeptidase/D-alanyl-D-alanine-endopeptidase (penicillin-binding protein 4)